MKKITTILLLCVSLLMTAQVPEKPSDNEGLVIDNAGVLSKSEENALEKKLIQFDSKTSTQIAIVTMDDLGGYPAIDMATRIMEKWGVGGSLDNNGIVIVFKPKTATSNGQVAITTGYGVEHLVTDALAKKIVEYDMIPYFKQGNIYEGFNKSTNVLMDLTAGEYTGSDYLAQHQGRRSGGASVIFIVILVIFVSRIGRARRFGQISGAGSSLPFWMMMGMMGSSSRHSGSFGDFSSGGGSFGGGFGGFGGGIGGGGGAGGSW